eukprot:Lankesteria_metandrocarpae@DN10339_c0_g1_i1.p1
MSLFSSHFRSALSKWICRVVDVLPNHNGFDHFNDSGNADTENVLGEQVAGQVKDLTDADEVEGEVMLFEMPQTTPTAELRRSRRRHSVADGCTAAFGEKNERLCTEADESNAAAATNEGPWAYMECSSDWVTISVCPYSCPNNHDIIDATSMRFASTNDPATVDAIVDGTQALAGNVAEAQGKHHSDNTDNGASARVLAESVLRTIATEHQWNTNAVQQMLKAKVQSGGHFRTFDGHITLHNGQKWQCGEGEGRPKVNCGCCVVQFLVPAVLMTQPAAEHDIVPKLQSFLEHSNARHLDSMKYINDRTAVFGAECRLRWATLRKDRAKQKD